MEESGAGGTTRTHNLESCPMTVERKAGGRTWESGSLRFKGWVTVDYLSGLRANLVTKNLFFWGACFWVNR